MPKAVAAAADSAVGPRLLTLDEAAAYLNTTRRHVRKMHDERRIPTIRVGKLIRIDRRDLVNWVEANRTEALR